jgi:formate dehydrogenase iron-sulfur subunit
MINQLDNNKVRAILTDTTMCTGCETCVGACKKTYGLARDRMWRWKNDVDSLSASRFCTIIRKPHYKYVRQQCRHCSAPACASACIVGALKKEENGPVTYDSFKCMGCRYCMMACPFGIPRYEWESIAPKVRKCILCAPRLAEGRPPACTEACPYGATIFGTRAEMLEVARKRIRDNPGRYYPADHPVIYGEHDVGGTSVLYLSDINLDFLGWGPKLGDTPLPALTWAALSKVPPVVLGMAGLMTGIYWVIGRRMQLEAEAAEAAGHPGSHPPARKEVE